MIEVVAERVAGFSIQYNDILWDIRPTTEDLADYTFQVERSEAEYGPYAPISPPMPDRYRYRDGNIPAHNVSRSLWYRVTVRNRRTNETVAGQPFDRRGPLSLEGAEAARQFSIYMRHVAGQRMWLLPVRTFGQVCPECTDHITGRQHSRECAVCWGTRFTGGYHYPVATWGTIQEAEHAIRVTTQATTQTRHVSVECEGSPDLHEGDLLIDRLNRRFRILVPSGTTRHQCIIHFKAQAVQILPSQIEYTIPVTIPEDGEDLPFAAFTQASTIDGLAGEYGSMGIGSRNW